MMATQKFCILCHYTTNDLEQGGYLGTSGSNFNTGLEACGNEDIKLINRFYSGIQISGFNVGELESLTNGNTDLHCQLLICGACRPVLVTTMERKAVLDEVEDNVRKMQLELLKELNKVKALVQQFYDDMKGVEERIGSRDQYGHISSGSPWNSCEVDLFERRIRKVVKDLSSCQVNRLQISEDIYPSPKPSSPPSPLSAPLSSPTLESDDDTLHPSNEEDFPDNQSDKEVSSDSDKDYDENPSKNKKTPKPVSRNSTIRNPNGTIVSSSSYDHCKTYAINKVLLRKEQILSGQPLPKKPGAKTDVEDPRDSYYIDYDPTTDSFSLDGIPITLNVTSQKLFNFNCSQCSFVTGHKKGKDKITPFLEILDHVLRLHRQIFQCSHCPKICSSLTRYREHVRGHQLKYVCHICGRPLQTRHNLDLHKWTHMNEKEREQAVKEGGKDPRTFINKIDGTTFQCSTCGKGFNRKGNLRLHERTHQDEETKRRICDKCGKSYFSHDSWFQHWKYCKSGVDVNGDQRSIQCTKCTNTFKNLKGLKSHLRRNHPGEGREKGMKCEICGWGFWTMSELKKHMVVHGDERPFECGRGCGMRFKLRGTWRHHQKCCDGSGTRAGPKNGKRRGKVVK